MVLTATFPVPTSWSRRKREAALTGTIQHIKKPDCDNLLKCVDALNQVVWGTITGSCAPSWSNVMATGPL